MKVHLSVGWKEILETVRQHANDKELQLTQGATMMNLVAYHLIMLLKSIG